MPFFLLFAPLSSTQHSLRLLSFFSQCLHTRNLVAQVLIFQPLCPGRVVSMLTTVGCCGSRSVYLASSKTQFVISLIRLSPMLSLSAVQVSLVGFRMRLAKTVSALPVRRRSPNLGGCSKYDTVLSHLQHQEAIESDVILDVCYIQERLVRDRTHSDAQVF